VAVRDPQRHTGMGGFPKTYRAEMMLVAVDHIDWLGLLE
jgi:hypothetical protein